MKDNAYDLLRDLLRRVDDTTLDRAMEAQSRACVKLESLFAADPKAVAIAAETGADLGGIVASGVARWIGKASPEDIVRMLSPFDPLLRPESYVAPCAPICATPGPYRVM